MRNSFGSFGNLELYIRMFTLYINYPNYVSNCQQLKFKGVHIVMRVQLYSEEFVHIQ